ncbi:MAG: hypothetical protein JWM11_4442 [Planctomycetaceae bacterium]|nr:hypothetical protein [Planctomycetaceae bacterium]
MQGRWAEFGLWSCLMLIPASGWSQELPRSGKSAALDRFVGTEDDSVLESRSVSSNSPLKLTRSGQTTEKPGMRSDKPSTRPTGWGTTAGSLVVVLTLIVGCGYLFKRQRVGGSGLLTDNIVQILGRKVIDQRTTLQLVRCGSKILILSNSTQHGVRTLSEITDAGEVETITSQCLSLRNLNAQGASISGFSGVNAGAESPSVNSTRSSGPHIGNRSTAPSHGGSPHV